MNDHLKSYIDNEISDDDRAKLDAELSDNAALFTELDELRGIGHYLEASAKPIEIKGLEKTLAALGGKAKRVPWYRTPYAVLAGATCVVALGMAMLPQGLSGMAQDTGATASSPVMSKSAAPMPEESFNQANPAADASADKDLAKGGEMAGAVGNVPTRTQESKPAAPEISVPNRQVIKTGNLNVRVKELNPAADRVEAIAKQYGGYLESKSVSGSGASKYASFTVRVDSRFFDQAMKSLRDLGDVTNESVTGQDVTGQVADTQARLKQMRLEEAQYQEVLKSARKIDDILQVKQYISDIRQEIEATEAQLKTLKSLSNLSTIGVTLEQRETVSPAPRTDWLSNTWIRAMNRFGDFGRVVVSAAINIVVLAPFWGPFALAIWWWSRRKNRR